MDGRQRIRYLRTPDDVQVAWAESGTGPTEVTKSGQVPGYTSQLILYPASDSGVFVSINTNDQRGPDPSGAVALQVAESVYQATRTEP